MSEEIELLREAVELLRLIAEPQIAKRDEKLRTSLFESVGKGKANAAAVVLMDGTRSQSAIVKQCAIDAGQLSRLIKALKANGLLFEGDNPRLRIPIPPRFPERAE